MARLFKTLALTIVAAVCCGALWTPAHATLEVFALHNHPNGDLVPPTYGLRIDNLIGSGQFTFSFDYSDVTGSAMMTLSYDTDTGDIHIYGRVYGGKDVGGTWDATLKGWMDVDYWFTENVSVSDDCPGNAGNDYYVTGMSTNNSGTFSLDGWGGDAVFNFTDKANETGCTFIFDNDTDSKNNTTIANDPTTYSGSGWLMPTTTGSRDWLFIGQMVTVPVEEMPLGRVKNMYR